jgi:hypothetical protein
MEVTVLTVTVMSSHGILGIFQSVNDTNNRAVLQMFQSSLALQIYIFAELASGSKDNRNELVTSRVPPVIRLPLQDVVKCPFFISKTIPKGRNCVPCGLYRIVESASHGPR